MSKLSLYGQDWESAPIESRDFITPEDGSYRVSIESVLYSEQDKNGNESDPTFIYTFRIQEGACAGARFRRYTTLRTVKSMAYFKGELKFLGLPIPRNPEDLPGIFLGIEGTVIDLTVKTKVVNGKDYKDIYFDKLIGKQAPQAQPAPIAQQQARQAQMAPQAPRPQQGYQVLPAQPISQAGGYQQARQAPIAQAPQAQMAPFNGARYDSMAIETEIPF